MSTKHLTVRLAAFALMLTLPVAAFAQTARVEGMALQGDYTHELLKRRSKNWLRAHIAVSLAFYLLLILHVWAAIYFGLRWFG